MAPAVTERRPDAGGGEFGDDHGLKFAETRRAGHQKGTISSGGSSARDL
jgi:hypothetical protein